MISEDVPIFGIAFRPLINIVGKQFSTKSDIAIVQWRMGLTRCSVSLPGRGLDSPAAQSFQWSAPFPISPPAERDKTELHQVSSDSRPKHHFKAPMTQRPDQEPGGCMLVGLLLTVSLCSGGYYILSDKQTPD